MAWYLNPALTNLRAEVDARWPGRDRSSDGTIGDADHQATSSDHNPDPDGSVDAWDMDVDGVDRHHIIERFEKHEAARYWINDGMIANREYGTDANGRWIRKTYTGSNPHNKHVHFNTRESHEDSTKPWGIEDDMAEFNQTNFTNFLAGALENSTVQARLRREVVSYLMDSDPSYNLLSLYTMLRETVPSTDAGTQQVITTVNQLSEDLAALAAAIAQGGNNPDTAAIIAAIQQGSADNRDAVADLGEGGAAQVRGPQE